MDGAVDDFYHCFRSIQLAGSLARRFRLKYNNPCTVAEISMRRTNSKPTPLSLQDAHDIVARALPKLRDQLRVPDTDASLRDTESRKRYTQAESYLFDWLGEQLLAGILRGQWRFSRPSRALASALRSRPGSGKKKTQDSTVRGIFNDRWSYEQHDIPVDDLVVRIDIVSHDQTGSGSGFRVEMLDQQGRRLRIEEGKQEVDTDSAAAADAEKRRHIQSLLLDAERALDTLPPEQLARARTKTDKTGVTAFLTKGGGIVLAFGACAIGLSVYMMNRPFFQKDPARQGALLAPVPIEPPLFIFRQDNPGAEGIVEVRARGSQYHILFTPRSIKRSFPDRSNILFEWRIIETDGAPEKVFRTAQPFILTATVPEKLGVNPLEYIGGNLTFIGNAEGKVAAVGDSGALISPYVDRIKTPDGVEIGTTEGDADSISWTIGPSGDVKLLDFNALAREHGVQSFSFGGDLDKPLPIDHEVQWQECLLGPAPEFKSVMCEERTIYTSRKPELLLSLSPDGKGRFKAPAEVAGQKAISTHWSIMRRPSGEVIHDDREGRSMSFAFPGPGSYRVVVSQIGVPIVKHHDRDKSHAHGHSYLYPLRGYHAVVEVE